MNKNLKKVISSVAALALSMTSISAFALDFSDVPNTANYYQAVQNLTALGIIKGYEDGTFKPDDAVTRAEFATMVAKARHGGDAEYGTSVSPFTDVVSGHWAAGFVATAVSDGIISGYGDGTFGPDDQVTYEQIMKMLVCAVGYGTYVDPSTYPAGYIAQANVLGIKDGVSIADTTAPATRKDVAMMINNALKSSIVTIDGYYPNGMPKYVTRDNLTGDDANFATLLSEYEDTYWVSGRVTGTKDSTSGSLKDGEVNFKIEYSKNFDQEYYSRSGDYSDITMLVGESGADKYLNSYGEALVKKTEDDDYVILTFFESGKNSYAEFKSDDFADDYKGYDGIAEDKIAAEKILKDGKIYVYQTGSTSKVDTYTLAKDDNNNVSVDLYVNGVEYTGDLAEGITKYVVTNSTGDVQLVDTPEYGKTSADGKYDIINVTYAGVGKVSSVTNRNDIVRINIGAKDGLENRLEIDTTDEDISYTVTMNGEEVELTDIQADDVIAVEYDVNTGVDNSGFYNIDITRGTVTGKLTRYSNPSTGAEYTFNGTVYTAVNSSIGIDPSDNTTEYELWVDKFGRILYAEEGATSDTYAIIEAVFQRSGEDNYSVRIITSTGESKTYTLKSTEDREAIQNICYSDVAAQVKNPIDQRVISYSVNNSNEIKGIEQENVQEGIGEYKASSMKVGSVRMSETTAVLNADEAFDYDETAGAYTNKSGYTTSDIKAGSLSSFTDGDDYVALGVGKSTNDSTYKFVILVDGNGGFSADTAVAVFDTFSVETYNDESVYAITAYESGSDETVTVYVDKGVSDFDKLGRGVPFMYSYNKDGIVDNNDDLLVLGMEGTAVLSNSFDSYSTTQESTLKTIYDAAKMTTNKEKDLNGFSIATGDSDLDGNDTDDQVRFIYAPVVKVSGRSVTLGKVQYDNGVYYSTDDDQVTFSVESDANVFVYDYSSSASYRMDVYNSESIPPVDVAAPVKLDAGTIRDGIELIDGTKIAGATNEAGEDCLATVKDAVAGTVIWNMDVQQGATNYVYAKTVDGAITDLVFYQAN